MANRKRTKWQCAKRHKYSCI